MSKKTIKKKRRKMPNYFKEALLDTLIQLDKEFFKMPLSSNPNMNRIITPRYLAYKVYTRLNKRLVKKIATAIVRHQTAKHHQKIDINSLLIEDLITDYFENLISENRIRIENEIIYPRGLRVRIGGINYP